MIYLRLTVKLGHDIADVMTYICIFRIYIYVYTLQMHVVHT